jgi:hypothetical protein
MGYAPLSSWPAISTPTHWAVVLVESVSGVRDQVVDAAPDP